MDSVSVFDCQLPSVEAADVASREDFDQRIRAEGRPRLFKGLVKSWPVVGAAEVSHENLVEHLKQMDVGATVPTFIARPDIGGRYFYTPDLRRFNFDKRDAPFRAILDKLLAQKDDPAPMGIYAGASPTAQTLPSFADQNPMSLLDQQTVPKIWVGNAATVAPHFDTSENIACVVSGVRRFVIFPPDQIKNLYIGPIDHNMAGQPASLVDLLNLDFERFPKVKQALEHAMVAELHPGDALYLPSLWWHFVESRGPLNVLVNYWFDEQQDGSPMNVLALALLVLRDLPKPEREAWRAVIDHYVFADDPAASVDHIPESIRGVLASKSADRDQKIKAFLRSQLPPVLS